MTPLRCHNCGLVGHKTQNCARFGPKYPEPGKTGQDYGDEAQRIANLFAADIIAEHNGHGHDGDEFENDVSVARATLGRGGIGGPPLDAMEVRRRSVVCETCNAQPGDGCVSKIGKPAKTHAARRRDVNEYVPPTLRK